MSNSRQMAREVCSCSVLFVPLQRRIEQDHAGRPPHFPGGRFLRNGKTYEAWELLIPADDRNSGRKKKRQRKCPQGTSGNPQAQSHRRLWLVGAGSGGAALLSHGLEGLSRDRNWACDPQHRGSGRTPRAGSWAALSEEGASGMSTGHRDQGAGRSSAVSIDGSLLLGRHSSYVTLWANRHCKCRVSIITVSL